MARAAPVSSGRLPAREWLSNKTDLNVLAVRFGAQSREASRRGHLGRSQCFTARNSICHSHAEQSAPRS